MAPVEDLNEPNRVPPWPSQKVARAHAHAHELRTRVDSWLASQPAEPVAEIGDDRLSWTLRLKVHQPAPLTEWSLILGDFVHNLRSAFDALVWELTSVGPGDTGATQIQFPIVSDPARWEDEARRRLRGLSEQHVTRIRELQPLNQPEVERGTNVLEILHNLDIVDKHHAGLTATVAPRGADHAGEVEFHSEEAAARNVPPQQTVHEPKLVDGAVLLEATTIDPIVKVRGGYTLQMEPQIETSSLGPWPLFGTLDQLAKGAAIALNHVMNGATAQPTDPA